MPVQLNHSGRGGGALYAIGGVISAACAEPIPMARAAPAAAITIALIARPPLLQGQDQALMLPTRKRIHKRRRLKTSRIARRILGCDKKATNVLGAFLMWITKVGKPASQVGSGSDTGLQSRVDPTYRGKNRLISTPSAAKNIGAREM